MNLDDLERRALIEHLRDANRIIERLEAEHAEDRVYYKTKTADLSADIARLESEVGDLKALNDIMIRASKKVAKYEQVREAATSVVNHVVDQYAVDAKYWTAVPLSELRALLAALADMEEGK